MNKFLDWEEEQIAILKRRGLGSKAQKMEQFNNYASFALGVAAVANYMHRNGIHYTPLWDPDDPYQIETFSAHGYLEPVKCFTTIQESRTELRIPMFQPKRKEISQGDTDTAPAKWFVKGLKLTNWWTSCRILGRISKDAGLNVAFDGIASRSMIEGAQQKDSGPIQIKVIANHDLIEPAHWIRDLLPTGVNPDEARAAYNLEKQKNERNSA